MYVSGFTNCTSKWLPIFILKVLCLITYNLILMIFIFHFGGKAPPPPNPYFQIWGEFPSYSPPPPPQTNIWCFMGTKSICEASFRGKFLIIFFRKFFVTFWNRISVHFNYISLYILQLTENLAKYNQVAKLENIISIHFFNMIIRSTIVVVYCWIPRFCWHLSDLTQLNNSWRVL
jgi:hypothetical protein